MARTNEELEAFLQKLERRFERVEDGTYLVAGAPNQPPIALRVAPPVLVLQVLICPAPDGETPLVARLFRRLLELNGNDLLHAAYSLEGGEITLGAALELDNLDLNEIEAVLADMDVALAEHIPVLREMVQDKV
jgi:hypothetical protein